MVEPISLPQAELEVKAAEPEVKQEAQPDLITRVSQVKSPDEAKQEIDEKFNINDLDKQIESVQDPTVKEQFLGLKKSLLRGENQKYQEIANLRKQYEEVLAQHTTWTPEKIQAALKDPNFVQAAQSILNNSSNTEDSSMLTERERKLLEENNHRVNEVMQQQQRLLKEQQDAILKQKYANYNPDIVDNIIKDVINGKAQINREHIWRAMDYEQGLKRAYDLGAQDKVVLNEDRVKAMSFDTNLNVAQPETVERQKGESTQKFIMRSYQQHTKKK